MERIFLYEVIVTTRGLVLQTKFAQGCFLKRPILSWIGNKVQKYTLYIESCSLFDLSTFQALGISQNLKVYLVSLANNKQKPI